MSEQTNTNNDNDNRTKSLKRGTKNQEPRTKNFFIAR